MSNREHEETAVREETDLVDEAEIDETVPPLRYSVTSYGASKSFIITYL